MQSDHPGSPTEGTPATPPDASSDLEHRPSTELLRAVIAQIPVSLPADTARETRLVLLDLDPCHVHAYWHLNAADLKGLAVVSSLDAEAEGLGSLGIRLRIHDARCIDMQGFVPRPPIELGVQSLDGYVQVRVPECGATLIGEIGLAAPTDTDDPRAQLIPLARSRPVRLPRPALPPPRLASAPSLDGAAAEPSAPERPAAVSAVEAPPPAPAPAPTQPARAPRSGDWVEVGMPGEPMRTPRLVPAPPPLPAPLPSLWAARMGRETGHGGPGQWLDWLPAAGPWSGEQI
jgi:hypothetical protein